MFYFFSKTGISNSMILNYTNSITWTPAFRARSFDSCKKIKGQNQAWFLLKSLRSRVLKLIRYYSIENVGVQPIIRSRSLYPKTRTVLANSVLISTFTSNIAPQLQIDFCWLCSILNRLFSVNYWFFVVKERLQIPPSIFSELYVWQLFYGVLLERSPSSRLLFTTSPSLFL